MCQQIIYRLLHDNRCAVAYVQKQDRYFHVSIEYDKGHAGYKPVQRGYYLKIQEIDHFEEANGFFSWKTECFKYPCYVKLIQTANRYNKKTLLSLIANYLSEETFATI